MIGLAKRNPGKLNGASGGNSTFMTLALFQLKTGTRIVNIPYKWKDVVTRAKIPLEN